MNKPLLRLAACCLVLQATWPAVPYAQAQTQTSANPASTVAGFNTEQLDALLAPIALYPDPLLTQILMASTYPLQIVEAARWMDAPAHKGLTGEALTKALESQRWDASVKSLVPFPQVVAMLNANLEWTQQLGYAFADQQAAVLDSVQRLRRQAQAKGSLASTPQQVVRTEQQVIVIEPAQPDIVYVPTYSPAVVYGTWPYPTYPPVYIAPLPAYPVATAFVSGLAFGAGVAVAAGLWNWAHPVWHGGYVNVNVNRYNNINIHNTQIRSNVWQPNRPGGHPAGMTHPPSGPVGRPAHSAGLPANAIGRSQVSVPRNAVKPPARSASGATRPGTTPSGHKPTQGSHPTTRPQPGPTNRSGAAQTRPQSYPGTNRPTVPSTHNYGQSAFSGINQGRQAQQFGQRGGQSRASYQMQRPYSGGRGGGHGRR